MPANFPYVEFAKDIKRLAILSALVQSHRCLYTCQSAPELKICPTCFICTRYPFCDERPTRLLDRGGGQSGILIKAARISDFIV